MVEPQPGYSPERAREPAATDAARAALVEPLQFLQENLSAVAYVMARIGDLLPPQIDEDEVIAHLVLRLAEGTYEPSARRDPAGWLWQEALDYLRGHPVVKAAARWLHARTDTELLTTDQLREVALALTVFGDLWLPGNDPDSQRLLAQALTRLPTDERLALAMYYFDGLTLPEIAEALDLPPDEASVLYANAMRHLKQNVAMVAMGDGGEQSLPRAA